MSRRLPFWPSFIPLIRVRLVVALAVSFLALRGIAQSAPADLLVTTGTTTFAAPSGQPLAYVTWVAGESTALNRRPFAVYSKPGGPDSPAPFERRQIITPVAGTADAAARLAAAAALQPEVPDAKPILTALAQANGLPASADAATALVTLVQASAANAALRADLELAAATQPAIALALGRAWTGELPPGPNTIELREWNPATQRDLRVVGRLVLDTTAPALLPPPGAPVQVPDTSAAGNRRIGLRWATSPESRRRTPLQTGFNVWRIPRADAVTRGWLAHTPSLPDLKSAATRVNDLPVMTARRFDDTTVANFVADPVTTFLRDDNGHLESHRPEFPDGAMFAYFVTARDPLGRDGQPSPAGVGIACTTLPPATPLRLEIDNVLSPRTAQAVAQTLEVSWDSDTNTLPLRADFYEIFRGTNAGDWRPDVPAAALRVGVTDQPPGGERLRWLDPAVAKDPANFGRTFWYAIRAVRNSPCGPIASPLSPPIRGTLRDFTAPTAPVGSIFENCPRVSVIYTESSQAPLAPGEPPVLAGSDGVPLRRHRVVIDRRGHGIAWARVTASDALGIVHDSGPVWFAPDEETLAFDFTRRLTVEAGALLQIECRTGTESGRALSAFHAERRADEIVVTRFVAAERSLADLDPSDPLSLPWLASEAPGAPPTCSSLQMRGGVGPDGVVELLGPVTPGLLYLVQAAPPEGRRSLGVFTAEPASGLPAGVGALVVRDPLLAPGGAGGAVTAYCAIAVNPDLDATQQPFPCTHEAFPSGSDRIVGPRLQVEFDSRTTEYRLYRRVDGGPLTLIAQGALPPDPLNPNRRRRVLRHDPVMPDAGGEICYFAQALDVHGNGSPMTPLGCVNIPPRALPVPVLARPDPAGNSQQPKLALTWMCPPAGVGRFEIVLHREKVSQSTGSLPGLGVTQASSIVQPPAGNPGAGGLHRVRDAFGQLTPISIPSERLLTDAVGSARIGDGPQFQLQLDVEEGATYVVFLKAVGTGPLFSAKRSDASFAYKFTWRNPAPSSPGIVPWPQRPLPAVGAFHNDILAMQLPGFARLWQTNADEAPVGVRIGRLPTIARDATDRTAPAPAAHYVLATLPRSFPIEVADPNLALFRERAGAAPRTNFVLLPVVLYRQQVPNGRFPKVRGDVVQVSPMIRQLAWEVIDLGQDLRAALLPDPFIAVTRHITNGDVTGGPPDLWLLDTHPVITGARYRYWLMRFTANGEPDITIPAGEVEVR